MYDNYYTIFHFEIIRNSKTIIILNITLTHANDVKATIRRKQQKYLNNG